MNEETTHRNEKKELPTNANFILERKNKANAAAILQIIKTMERAQERKQRSHPLF